MLHILEIMLRQANMRPIGDGRLHARRRELCMGHGKIYRVLAPQKVKTSPCFAATTRCAAGGMPRLLASMMPLLIRYLDANAHRRQHCVDHNIVRRRSI